MKNIVFIMLMGLSLNAEAQLFSNMPFTTAQTTNPALIALPELPQLNVFGSYNRYFSSTYFGYSQYSKKLKGSIGINYNGIYNGYNLPYNYNTGTIGINYAKLFNLNEKWKYSLGVGVDFAGNGWMYNGESGSSFALVGNFGGVLYADRFFTSLNVGFNLSGRYQYGIRTGYKLTPFRNKDFSITPVLSLTKPFAQGGGPTVALNVNLSYNKIHFNTGFTGNDMNVGIGYDFKRFRLNYSIAKAVFYEGGPITHQFGLQFNLNKKHDPKKTEFNHRLF
ncbi:MAG: hypothetical protein AB8B72_06275 [Crocinitomicaceae bacterium]